MVVKNDTINLKQIYVDGNWRNALLIILQLDGLFLVIQRLSEWLTYKPIYPFRCVNCVDPSTNWFKMIMITA